MPLDWRVAGSKPVCLLSSSVVMLKSWQEKKPVSTEHIVNFYWKIAKDKHTIMLITPRSYGGELAAQTFMFTKHTMKIDAKVLFGRFRKKQDSLFGSKFSQDFLETCELKFSSESQFFFSNLI
jgi:hypothetical protein